MRMCFRTLLSGMLLWVVLGLAPEVTYAYGGPGSVISGIGTFLALLAALVASLFGFVWFPLKRLYKRVTSDNEDSPEATVSGQ